VKHWNYRVVRSFDYNGCEVHAVHEVQYDAKGAIESFTENPAVALHVFPGDPGTPTEGLREVFAMMLSALHKPIIDSLTLKELP
jgi:hypothetical protein